MSNELTEEIEKKCNGLTPCEYMYVYIVEQYFTPKSKRPYNMTVYKSAESVAFVFNTCSYSTGNIKIQYKRVCKDSDCYESAI